MAQLQRLVISSAQCHDQTIALTQEQQHYLGRVLRLRRGDQFIAMDGAGQSWLCQIQATEGRATMLEPLEVATELPVAVTLVLALPKGSGLDDIVRQATELGVAHLVPVISDRTLANPSGQKLERWRRIAQEAAEQSERQTVPTLEPPVSLKTYLADNAGVSEGETIARYICVTRQSAPHLLDQLLQVQPHPPKQIQVAIGPEGGWTELEVEQAIAAGYQPVSLGCRILRAITAPIVALSLIAAVYENRQQ